MLLKDAGGPNRLTIGVTGYQFPDAPDPARRFSWHMVGGQARCEQGSWRFHWQALTCDESLRVSAWLRQAARSVTRQCELPAPLQFLEPNLMFRALPPGNGTARVQVSLDLEFQPPWHQRKRAGDPFTLSFATSEEQLRQAAERWDAERSPFPDRPHQ
jgi:hypothetical protein